MNRKLLAPLAALVLAGSLVALYLQARRPPTPQLATHAWFYDLNTGQLFPAPRDAIPPVAAPSGPLPDGSPAGVRAHVYGCSDCTGGDRLIAYLETYTPADGQRLQDLRNRLQTAEPEPPQTLDPRTGFGPGDEELLTGRRTLVKRPADADWVARDSPAGSARLAAASLPCPPGIFPRECFP